MISRNIKLILALSVMAMGVSSCLEKYPSMYIPEDDAMETFNDASQHRTGIYVSLMNSALYSGYLTLLPDIQADMVYAVEGNSNTYGDFWQWKIRSNATELEAVYASLYEVIGNCNFFLEHVDTIIAKETDDTNIEYLENYKGEAIAVRALCYSELLKCFCKAYDSDEQAKQELGVVLRTRYSVQEPVTRATLYDSYHFVVDELDKAEKLLDPDLTDTPSTYSFSQAAVQALHARVSLYMCDWENAIKYSSILIDEKKDKFQLSGKDNSNLSGYTWFDYMWAYDAATEVIWEIGFNTTSYGGALGTVFLNFTRDYTNFYPDYVPGKDILDLYDDASDCRYSAYFADSEDTGINIGWANGLDCPVLTKYLGNEQFMQQAYLYHVSMPKPFRLAEQYLIRAEAYCRTNNFTKATADMTALRDSRYTSGGSISMSAANWEQNISEERVRELYMEGFRLHDLKRWHKGFERKPQEYAGLQKEGSSLKVEADNPLFVWPIPVHELNSPGADIQPNESN